MNQKLAFLSLLLVALCCYPARGQAPPAVFTVELQNMAFYEIDTADSSLFGINPGLTRSTLSCTAPSFQGHLGNRFVALDSSLIHGIPNKITARPSECLTGKRDLSTNPTPLRQGEELSGGRVPCA